jgi:hypothetical protein
MIEDRPPISLLPALSVDLSNECLRLTPRPDAMFRIELSDDLLPLKCPNAQSAATRKLEESIGLKRH